MPFRPTKRARWINLLRAGLLTADAILLYALSPITLWIFVACISVWYTLQNTLRSRAVKESRTHSTTAPESEKYLSSRRYDQERILFAVVLVMFSIGISALFLKPNSTIVKTFIEMVLPIQLIVAHIGLSIHSYIVHSNHHVVISILTAESLERQFLARRLSVIEGGKNETELPV